MVCFISKDLSESALEKVRTSTIVRMEERFEIIKNAYKSKHLGLKDEDADVFAGHDVTWNGNCFTQK